jgi:signal transduction histidine kinase
MGIGLSFILGRFIITPVKTLITGMTKLAEGDFSTRITLGKYVDSTTDISKSFNALATQLQDTEILRSDFVNNFSHEVKTPLVSITGLVSLLKNDKLPKEKRIQYIELIEEEIQRLSSMTTNMLNLSKLEKQEIVTDKTTFNLSEQIRTCVLLLEKKWTKKHTRLALDFDEHMLYANEDLLKQVWINLIDNSIKFSKDKGKVSIGIEESKTDICVSISNTGEKIKDDDMDKIFNKFYQSDSSRHKEGHGIGLSIVSRIVYLHNGKVTVTSNDERTTFSVILPKNSN